MLKTNKCHKRAILKTISKTGKGILALGLAGVSGITIYTEVLKFETDVTLYAGDYYGTNISEDYNLRELVNGKATEEYNKEFLKRYNDYLESNGCFVNAEKGLDLPEIQYRANASDDDIVILDNDFKKAILRSLYQYTLDYEYDENEQVTIGKLKQLGEVKIEIDKNVDLSWLNYCTNLNRLELIIEEEYFNTLKTIKTLPSLYNFVIEVERPTNYGVQFDEMYFSFLKNSPNLRFINLDASYFVIQTEFINKLAAKVDNFGLGLHSFSSISTGIDYSKLTNVSQINFTTGSSGGVYDIVSAIDKDSFEMLINLGINFEMRTNCIGAFRVRTDGKMRYIKHDEIVTKAREIYQRLDKIVSSLDIKDNDTKLEKFNKALQYVLENLQYCEILAEKQEDGLDVNIFGNVDQELNELARELCYADGYMYGAFEENGEAICGTYATLLSVILREIGFNSQMMLGNLHAWTLVEIDDRYFYTDPTILDTIHQDVVDMDAVLSHPAYLMDTSFKFRTYNPDNLPIEVKEMQDISSVDMSLQIDHQLKEYKIKFRNRIYIISSLAFISLLSGLGIIISENKLKKMKKQAKQNQSVSIFDDLEHGTPRR